MHDYIDPIIAIPFAIILWSIVILTQLWVLYKTRLDNYFAMRRHFRRVRNRAMANAQPEMRHRKMNKVN